MYFLLILLNVWLYSFPCRILKVSHSCSIGVRLRSEVGCTCPSLPCSSQEMLLNTTNWSWVLGAHAWCSCACSKARWVMGNTESLLQVSQALKSSAAVGGGAFLQQDPMHASFFHGTAADTRLSFSLGFWIKWQTSRTGHLRLPWISAHWLSLPVALCCRMRRRGIASALAGGVEEGCCLSAGDLSWEFRANGTDGNMYREKEAEKSCDAGRMHWLYKKYWSNKVCFPEVGRVGSKVSVVSQQLGCGVFRQKTAWYQTVFLVWV